MKGLLIQAGNSYQNNAAAQLIDNYSGDLLKLAERGPGKFIFGEDGGDKFADNSFSKLNLPETQFWLAAQNRDSTYHKYDVVTYVGREFGDFNAKYVETVLLKGRYSFPGEQMKPVSNAADGGDRLVYVAPPTDGALSDSRAYLVPVGLIEQAHVPGGIQNITTADHGVYQGTIRRTVVDLSGHIFILTHGEGINKAFDASNNALTRKTFDYAAKQNDIAGAKAFQRLDQQIVRDFSLVMQKYSRGGRT